MAEFTAGMGNGGAVKINRLPETIDEMKALMEVEKITDFKDKVIFLQGAMQHKTLHGFKIEGQEASKCNMLFIEYLKSEQEHTI